MNEKQVNFVAPVIGTIAGLSTAYLLSQRMEKSYQLATDFAVSKAKVEAKGEKPKKVEDPKAELKRAAKIVAGGLAVLWVAGFIEEAVEDKIRNDWGPQDNTTVIDVEFVE